LLLLAIIVANDSDKKMIISGNNVNSVNHLTHNDWSFNPHRRESHMQDRCFKRHPLSTPLK